MDRKYIILYVLIAIVVIVSIYILWRFYLKNKFGYTDRQEVESKNINVNQDVSNLSQDDRQKRIKELLSKREK